VTHAPRVHDDLYTHEFPKWAVSPAAEGKAHLMKPGGMDFWRAEVE
jgi:hypothetical protein